jgi:hypothetical protein
MVVRVDFDYKEATFTAQEVDQLNVEAQGLHKADQAALLAWGKHKRQQASENGAGAVPDGIGEVGSLSFPAPRLVTGRVSLEKVKQDRKRFFDKLKARSDLYQNLLGYAWRIDCAREAGFHLHVAFFFNGHDVEKHEHYAHELGMLWVESVGEDRGYFYNCNLDKNKFERNGKWGLGLVDYDAKKREILLNDVLGYFVEDDKILQYVLEDESHMFGTVFVKKPTAETRGRPRGRKA